VSTTNGWGSGRSRRGEPKVGARGDGGVNGSAILEDTIPVDGSFKFEEGVQRQRQVVHGGREEVNGGSGGRCAGESLAIPETSEGTTQLRAVDSTTDAVVEDVLEGVLVKWGSGPFTIGHKGRQEAETGEVLGGKLSIAMNGVVEVVDTGVEMGQGSWEEAVQDGRDQFGALVAEGGSSVQECPDGIVVGVGRKDNLGHGSGDFNSLWVGGVSKGLGSNGECLEAVWVRGINGVPPTIVEHGITDGAGPDIQCLCSASRWQGTNHCAGATGKVELVTLHLESDVLRVTL
jgi:hypothetical protein